MMKRVIVVIAMIAILIPLFQGCTTIKHIEQKYFADNRPNFVIIVSDDQRFDTMQYMPQTQQKIFDQGVTFTHGYITTPLCCPSRVGILTGSYAHNTLVRNNENRNNNTTIIENMHAQGYFTGLVGKYLNSWNGDPRPEYDFWVSYFRGESPYYNPRLNANGNWFTHIGYITDILGTYSLQFVKEAIKQDKPWILIYAPIAPHDPTKPFVGDQNLYTDLQPFRPPSFNEADISDKPAWLQNKQLLDEKDIAAIDKFRRDQILTLVSLDRAVGMLMDSLEKQDQLRNTFVLYISDNGKFWGEHRITSKNSFYEEAIKVPFAIRYPPLVPQPYLDDHLVANIDIAPTIYELSKVKPRGLKIDGMSLVGLLNKSVKWREDLLLEGWPPRGFFSAIHTDRYVYAETQGDRSEFYDLQIDPFELTNQVDDPAYKDIIKELQGKLYKIREPANAPTLIPDVNNNVIQ
jgi:N-acetylglucosamine-6-sulfatase